MGRRSPSSAVADVVLASGTHPFTLGADVVTAVPLALAALLVALPARLADAADTVSAPAIPASPTVGPGTDPGFSGSTRPSSGSRPWRR